MNQRVARRSEKEAGYVAAPATSDDNQLGMLGATQQHVGGVAHGHNTMNGDVRVLLLPPG
ncbi:Uncharacterised protein [Mycobacteroides abscessus subsp. abscessus]|nr:Uncharacterised protein [Mycobacteroides abscessus subsp. abscessus]